MVGEGFPSSTFRYPLKELISIMSPIPSRDIRSPDLVVNSQGRWAKRALWRDWWSWREGWVWTPRGIWGWRGSHGAKRASRTRPAWGASWWLLRWLRPTAGPSKRFGRTWRTLSWNFWQVGRGGMTKCQLSGLPPLQHVRESGFHGIVGPNLPRSAWLPSPYRFPGQSSLGRDCLRHRIHYGGFEAGD